MGNEKHEAASRRSLPRLVLPPHYVRKELSLYWSGKGQDTMRVWIVYDKATNHHIAEGDTIKEARENARKILAQKSQQNKETSQ